MKFCFSTKTYSHVRLKYNTIHSLKKDNHKSLILLHGLLGSKNNWKGISTNKEIKELRNLIKVDLRNHGSSDHHENMTYEEMAYDLHKLVTDELNYSDHKKFTLLGHSMGGKVAMTYSCMYPETLDGLIILDSSPEDYSEHHKEYFGSLTEIIEFTKNLKLEGKTREQLGEELKNKFGNDFSNLISSNLVMTNSETEFKWRTNLNNISNNMNHILGWSNKGQYSGPVVIICGDKSKQYELKNFKSTFPNIKDGDCKVIRDASHWVHADKPNEVSKEIIGFLKYIDKTH